MNRIFVLLLLCVGIGPASLQAQLADKLVPHLGFMWEVATYDNGGCLNDQRTSFYTLSLGAYYTLAHTDNDVASVGFDPNVNFGINLVGNGYISYVIQAPVFVMGRLGANATTYNQQKIGIGAGLGLNYTYFSQKITTNTRRIAGFAVPAAVVEVTILSGGAPLTGRIHFNLGQTSSDIKCRFDSGGEDLTNTSFGNFGFGLIYGL